MDKYYAYPAWEAVNTNTYINYIVTTCFQEILGHMLEDRPLEQVELMKALLKFRSLEPFRYPMVELALRVKHELNVHIDVMKVVLEKIFQQLDFNVTYKPDLNHYFLLSDPDLMLETLRISIQKALDAIDYYGIFYRAVDSLFVGDVWSIYLTSEYKKMLSNGLNDHLGLQWKSLFALRTSLMKLLNDLFS